MSIYRTIRTTREIDMPKTIASRCASAACVAVTEHTDGIDFTSTLGADKGRVTYTPAEVAQFLGDVKAGHYDRFLDAVPATV